MRRCRPIADRLWAKVAKGGPDECWEWMGNRRQFGHGVISIGRAGEGLAGTHRVAWELANGMPVPPGLVVRHTCDNPPCCNPAHLLIGTQADNVRDAVERGRVAREFQMPHTRVSDEAVRYIREHYRQWTYHKSNARELAEEFGISPDHITRIVRGERRTAA